MKIKIGADELILWLRKNNIATSTPNDEANGLGFRICRIIEDLGGEKIEDNSLAYWPIPEGAANIDKYKLPKTSAQYEIDVDKVSSIYLKLLEELS